MAIRHDPATGFLTGDPIDVFGRQLGELKDQVQEIHDLMKSSLKKGVAVAQTKPISASRATPKSTEKGVIGTRTRDELGRFVASPKPAEKADQPVKSDKPKSDNGSTPSIKQASPTVSSPVPQAMPPQMASTASPMPSNNAPDDGQKVSAADDRQRDEKGRFKGKDDTQDRKQSGFFSRMLDRLRGIEEGVSELPDQFDPFIDATNELVTGVNGVFGVVGQAKDLAMKPYNLIKKRLGADGKAEQPTVNEPSQNQGRVFTPFAGNAQQNAPFVRAFPTLSTLAQPQGFGGFRPMAGQAQPQSNAGAASARSGSVWQQWTRRSQDRQQRTLDRIADLLANQKGSGIASWITDLIKGGDSGEENGGDSGGGDSGGGDSGNQGQSDQAQSDQKEKPKPDESSQDQTADEQPKSKKKRRRKKRKGKRGTATAQNAGDDDQAEKIRSGDNQRSQRNQPRADASRQEVGSPSPTPDAQPKEGFFKRVAAGAKGLGAKAGGAVAGLIGAADVASIITDDSLSLSDKLKNGATAAGGALGGMGGAAAGAAIGTAIFPVVGTAIGAALGGWIGSEGGTFIGEKAGEILDSGMNAKETQQAKAEISSAASNFYGSVVSSASSLFEFIGDKIDAAKNAVSGAWSAVKDTVSSVGGAVGGAMTGGGVASPNAQPISSGKKQDEKQMMVFSAFKKAGFTDEQAKAMTAEVGRENDYNDKSLFGKHTDAANGVTNQGFFSWQGERRDRLVKHMASKGLVDENGNFKVGQASLDAQAEFAKQEIMTDTKYAKTKDFMQQNPNAKAEDMAQVLGKNYIKWAYGQDVLKSGAKFDWRKHDGKRRGYLLNLEKNIGKGDAMMAEVKQSSAAMPMTDTKSLPTQTAKPATSAAMPMVRPTTPTAVKTASSDPQTVNVPPPMLARLPTVDPKATMPATAALMTGKNESGSADSTKPQQTLSNPRLANVATGGASNTTVTGR